MNNDFPLPEGLFGRFGVVKLWPGIKTAEDECIARLKLAAKAIGVECVEILADGGFVSAPDIKASKACLLYTSPSPRDRQKSRMPSSA